MAWAEGFTCGGTAGTTRASRHRARRGSLGFRIERVREMAVLLVIGVGALACADTRLGLGPKDPERVAPGSVRPTVGGFTCGVTYTVITETNDAELAAYDVEPLTDTASVCQTWTGSDYQVEVTQIGSSEPASDFAEDIKTAVYQNGTTSAYDANGIFAESQPDIGPTGFEFVAATEEEKQVHSTIPITA